MQIEFVSYTGKWPNLCSGILTLKIDGVGTCFGDEWDLPKEMRGKITLNSRFWSSGGGCGFHDGYSNSYCYEETWIIDADLLPDELKPYATEIANIFNENVEHGCCGGYL